MASETTYTIDSKGRPTIAKDPDAQLDYTWDFRAWLAKVGDAIADHEILVDGCTLDASQLNGGYVTAWLSGGTVGTKASATCRVTTAHDPPRIDDRTIFLKIAER